MEYMRSTISFSWAGVAPGIPKTTSVKWRYFKWLKSSPNLAIFRQTL